MEVNVVFSETRLPDELATTEYAKRLDRARRRAQNLLDLTVGNPTVAFPERRRELAELMEAAVADDADRPYRPAPLGRESARRSVARYYRRRGVDVDPAQVVLTASTSEAYAWIGKLFADPGGAVAVPTPSYPLFEHLLGLEALEAATYRFLFEGDWAPDVERLAERIQEQSIRAVVNVSPNNPTGHTLDGGEYASFADIAAGEEIPLVVDEVFLDYHHGESAADSVLALAEVRPVEERPLTLVLSGLSKVAGAPGVKLGWIVLDGPDDLVDRVRRQLAFVADTYLSASDPAQALAPRALETAGDFHETVRGRLRRNKSLLGEEVERTAASLYPVDAGWYGVLRLPDFFDEREFVADLVETYSTSVRPGFLFDLDRGPHVVVSLLTPGEEFRRGVGRLLEAVEERA